MTFLTVVVAVFAALVILYLRFGLIIVQQSERVVIERLGSYRRTLEPGINLVVPFIDKPRSIKMRRFRPTGLIKSGELEQQVREETHIDVRETVLDFPQQAVVTSDNVTTMINGVLYFQIIDPRAAVYEIENFTQAIETLAKTTIRSVIGTMELDKVFESREDINQKLAAVLDEAGGKWGVKVNRVEIQDIEMPEDVVVAMHKQMAAERERRATVTRANGDREAAVARAQGDREAAILRAQGQQKAIQLLLESGKDTDLAGRDIVSYLMALEYMKVLPDIAKEGERVFLPYEATGVLSAIEAIRDLAPGGTKRGG